MDITIGAPMGTNSSPKTSTPAARSAALTVQSVVLVQAPTGIKGWGPRKPSRREEDEAVRRGRTSAQPQAEAGGRRREERAERPSNAASAARKKRKKRRRGKAQEEGEEGQEAGSNSSWS